MSQAVAVLSLRPESAALLEQAVAALAALGLSVQQAGDLQFAANLAADVEDPAELGADSFAAIGEDLVARAVALLSA
jgi:hypothetical protein